MEEKAYGRCKSLMIVFNVLFMLGGLALVGLGVWVVVDHQSFSGAVSANVIFQYAAYIVIGVGSLIAIISFCGCCGAWKENKCLLVTFITFIVIFLVIETATLILAFLFTSTFEPVIREASLATIALYNTDNTNPVTTSWDTLHTSFQCCGYNNGQDFGGSVYDQQSSGNPWPESCCVREGGAFVDVSSCLQSPIVSSANSNANKGCFSALRDLLNTYAAVVGGVTAGLMILQLLAVIFACCVSCNIRSNKVGQAQQQVHVLGIQYN